MYRTVTTLILAGAALGAPSLASASDTSPSPLAKAFGNTIVSTYPDGRKAELWLRPDGGYSAQGRRGDPSSGTWSVSGAKVCLKQQKPFWAPFSFCTAIPPGGVGSSWTAKAVTGETVRVRLVQGRG
jgi:hypothetical protein